MRSVDSAVIAAAGIGSRLGLGMPKCMIEIGGRPLLDRLIETVGAHVAHVMVVVGYREEIVIERCRLLHRNVVIVRNPEYRTTNTAYSHALGSRAAAHKVVYLDGDLLITDASLGKFLEEAKRHDHLVAFTEPKSENAVFIHGSPSPVDDLIRVDGFTREDRTPYEWANVVVGPPDLLTGATGYVFEHLIPHLPMMGHRLDLAEIDTQSDLDVADAFVMSHRLNDK